MNSNKNIFDLWHQQQAAEPPAINELVKKAQLLKNKVRNRLVGAGLLLIGTMAFIVWIVMAIDTVALTTKLGIATMLSAMILVLVYFANTILYTRKFPLDASGKDALQTLIGLRKKQQFMQRVIMGIYFLLLSAGLFLYMLEFILRMETLWAAVSYGLTALWIAFSWFYLRPRTIKKQQKELNELISEFERISQQLD